MLCPPRVSEEARSPVADPTGDPAPPLSDPGDTADRPLVRLRGRSFDPGNLVGFERHGLQPVAIDLAQGVAGHFVEYPEALGDFIGCKPRRDVAEDFGNDRVLCPVGEHDEAEHALTEHGIRYAYHGGFPDRRMRGDQRLLHFDRRDVGAAANDDVFLAGYEPELV